jgi:hypothetical protein
MNPFLSLRNYEEFVYTLPHHKHILPDIKHHRIPAPDMSFTHPNYSRNRGVAKGMKSDGSHYLATMPLWLAPGI